MSNAERMKAYRERKKREDPDYTKKESEKRKQRRLTKKSGGGEKKMSKDDKCVKTKSIEEELIDTIRQSFRDCGKGEIKIPTVKEQVKQSIKHSLVQLEELKSCSALVDAIYEAQLLDNKGNRGSSKTTIKQYIGKVSKLYRDLTGNKRFICKDFSFLRDTSRVKSYLDRTYSNIDTQKAFYIALTKICKFIVGYTKEYHFYSDMSTELAQLSEKSKDDNLLTEKELKNWVPFDKLEKVYKNEDGKAKALCAMLTMLPPRRLMDYIKLKMVRGKNKKQIESLSGDYNYIITNKSRTPKYVIYNVFKTQKKYTQQSFDIPRNLAKILQKYFKARAQSIVNGSLIFPTTTGLEYKQSNFSKYITQIFRSTGKDVTVNILRHSIITHLLNRPNVSLATKKKLATQMAHSIETQAKYLRINPSEVSN